MISAYRRSSPSPLPDATACSPSYTPDFAEMQGFSEVLDDLFTLLWLGGYTRIYDQNIPAHQWLADYIATYVQRDVRQVLNDGDLQTFSNFLKLCAGRTAQEINLGSLGWSAIFCRSAQGQLRLHPLQGAIFESWVVSELYKTLAHQRASSRFCTIIVRAVGWK